MEKFILFILVISLTLGISCADQLGGAGSNQAGQTNTSATQGATQNASKWTKVELPLDRSPDVIAFGAQGRIAVAGEGILLLSLDSGQTWRSVSEGKGSNMYTTDGRKFQDESQKDSISIAKLCSVEAAVFSRSGRLYLNTTCEHSSALWSLPTENISDPWYVRAFAPSPEQFEKSGDYSSPGRNLIATSRRVLVDGRLSNETVLFTTEDQGASWQPLWRDSLGPRIVGLDFIDEHNGWMLQAEGKLLRTQDGGSTWVANGTLPANAVGRVVSIEFVNPTTGIAVGQEGLILTTKDGGRSWQQQISDTKASLSRAAGVDENNAWVVGESGTLLETNDGGRSWQMHSLGVDEDIQTITVNNGVAWLVAGRNVYRSK